MDPAINRNHDPIHHQKLRHSLKSLKYLPRYIRDNKDSLELTYDEAYFTTYMLFRVHRIYKAKKERPRKKHDDIGKATKTMSRARTLVSRTSLRSCMWSYRTVMGLRALKRGSAYNCQSCQPLLLLQNVEQLQRDRFLDGLFYSVYPWRRQILCTNEIKRKENGSLLSPERLLFFTSALILQGWENLVTKGTLQGLSIKCPFW